MKRRWTVFGFAALSLMLTGCESLVSMEYDQTNNFRIYQFAEALPIGITRTETGMEGFYDGNPPVYGFWVTYLLCSVDNQDPNAQAFNYDVSKFYVIFEGRRHYYRPLDPFTYETLPNGFATPAATDAVNMAFRNEVRLGPDTAVFPRGFSGGRPLNYRFAIYVTKAPFNSPDSTGSTVDTSVVLPLRYDGAPNLLKSRNQPPLYNQSTVARSSLLTSCRPQSVTPPTGR